MSLLTYLLFRLFTYPFTFLPYPALHAAGRLLGSLLFALYPKYRKRALSNLALATDLHLSSSEIPPLAKASLQSLAITFLEYPKLYRETNIARIAACENPDEALNLLKTGKGVIFFCGHQANWELFFLEGTARMPGVAIGRPIKNKFLYAWVLRLRQKFGGKIVSPKEGVKEGLRALKKGAFFGIVGDQGMPDSGFSCSFLGRKAWTSPLPALLSLRTGCPIIVATIQRLPGKYVIHYSAPLLPGETDTPATLMEKTLALFEASVKKRPQEWLWIHNRWKQQLPGKLPSCLRHDAVALVLSEKENPDEILPLFRTLYPSECVAAFIPHATYSGNIYDIEIHPLQDVFAPDYRFKLIYDFTGDKQIAKHFKALSALHIVTHPSLEELKTYLTQNFSPFGCVKASGLNDRKRGSIE